MTNKSHLGEAISKWLMTTGIAALPLFVHIVFQLRSGGMNWPELCETGEVYLVAIVMLVEPWSSASEANLVPMTRRFLYLAAGGVIVMAMINFSIMMVQSHKAPGHTETGDIRVHPSGVLTKNDTFVGTIFYINSTFTFVKDTISKSHPPPGQGQPDGHKEFTDYFDSMSSFVILISSFLVGLSMILVAHKHKNDHNMKKEETV